MEPQKLSTIQVKLPQSVKDKILKKAAAANTSLSEYIRFVASTDQKVIFLDDSGSIAKSLAEISINLDRALRVKGITTEQERALLEKFHDIWDSFYDILERISTINNFEIK